MSYNTKNYTEQGGETTHIGGNLVFDSGANVEGFPYDVATADKLGAVKPGDGLSVSNGELSVTPATTEAIGGVKVGTGLSVTSAGVLSVNAAADAAGIVKQAANQAASTAADVAGVVADLNALIGKLKTAGIMVADAEE